ncbi:MAG: S41 family peptidase [Candidatus Bathyarchaeota archaeon]|nr:S41 family peptidase [Candidatus Bathyarchaeota archaeon]
MIDSISKDDLIQDIDFYISSIEKVHGNPYRLISKEEFLENVEKVKDQIHSVGAENFSVIESYYYLQQIAVSIRDGHTKVSASPKWKETINTLFPLEVVAIDNRLFVSENLSNEEVPEGAEILSINGIPTGQMISDTLKYVEGTLLHYKMVHWSQYLPLFVQTYYMMKSPWTVTFRYDGEEKTKEIPSIVMDEESEKSRLRKRYAYSESSLTVDGEAVPILHIPHLGYGTEKMFRKFVDDFFSRHKDRRYLIIDIRRCPGGQGERGFEILDYLTDARALPEYRTFARFAHRISEAYREEVENNIRSMYVERKIPRFLWWIPFYKLLMRGSIFADKCAQVLSAEVGEYTETNHYHKTRRRSNRFKGKVFLLTSHETFSAGVVFAAVFKHNGSGTVVGQETGGRLGLLSDPIELELPHSKLKAQIPVAILELPGEDLDRGLTPDLEVAYTPEYCIHQTDKHLATLRELIKTDASANVSTG